VYQSDLEKAVQYSLMTEVANQSLLYEAKVEALKNYLLSLLNFLPNTSKELQSFLLGLMEWLQSMQFKTVTPAAYKAKIQELSDLHEPFSSTPEDWSQGGCAGSSPEKRGYPCSLWTLFHALMANSIDKDPSWNMGMISSVAKTMVGYITFFFSCRDCAVNFQDHVTNANTMYHLGSPDQSLLWLWSIHNMANMKLAGDQTEDPMAPKIQWPSQQNCPTCKINGFSSSWSPLKRINGELWNELEVIKYLKHVYHPNQIIQPNKEDHIKKVLDELQEKLNSSEDSIFEEAHKKIVSYCQRR